VGQGWEYGLPDKWPPSSSHGTCVVLGLQTCMQVPLASTMPAAPNPQTYRHPSSNPPSVGLGYWRNQTQYKVLLGGIHFSPFNRLEVFYIRRKTTFELVVLFSELCFVFALIKFPLTQISIKCGSHRGQTLATPCLLLLGRRTHLCYGNVAPEQAQAGGPTSNSLCTSVCACFAVIPVSKESYLG
jgi:hypothetical protein